MYISADNSNDCSSGIIIYDMSDHFPVFTCVGNTNNSVNDAPLSFKYRKFGEPVYNQLHGMLAGVNCDFIETLDRNDACKMFLSVINEYVDLVALDKTVTIPPHKIIREPQYTRGLLKSRNTSDKLYRKKYRSLPGSQNLSTIYCLLEYV